MKTEFEEHIYPRDRIYDYSVDVYYWFSYT